jgi:GGDEF domain-containing protein
VNVFRTAKRGGLTPEEAMAQPIERIHPPESLAISLAYFTQLIEDLRAGRPPQFFRGELEYYCRDGSTVGMDVIALPALDEQGAFLELLGVSRTLVRLATTDGLTGLWNRRELDERVRREIDRADRYGDELSLVLFDIDHFKDVNDRFGHLAGDHVLVELRRRVEAEPFPAVGRVTISSGVVQRRPRESAEAWFHRLDRVLYRAKELGRNRVELEPEPGR